MRVIHVEESDNPLLSTTQTETSTTTEDSDQHQVHASTGPCTGRRRFINIGVVIAVILIGTGVIVVVTSVDDTTNLPNLTSEFKDLDETPCLFRDIHTAPDDELKDKCSPDSTFVRNSCNRFASHEGCRTCGGNSEVLLPKFCFCDSVTQCPDKITDSPIKEICINCTERNSCPCSPYGSCNCEGRIGTLKNAENLNCTCRSGYSGKYCNFVPIRLCNRTQEIAGLHHCVGSTDPHCFIQDNFRNNSYKCSVYTEEDLPKDITNCTLR